VGKVREVGVKIGEVIADGAMTSDVKSDKRLKIVGVECSQGYYFTSPAKSVGHITEKKH
jgi:hypothetical protein